MFFKEFLGNELWFSKNIFFKKYKGNESGFKKIYSKCGFLMKNFKGPIGVDF